MGMLATLITGLASGETIAALRRARTAAMVYLLAGIVALCGVGFLIGAAYIWTAIRYGSQVAALSFGAGFLVAAGLILVVYKIAEGSRLRRRAERRKADVTAVGVTAALAVMPTLLKGKSGLGVILGSAAALAAYALYRQTTRPGGPDGGGPR
ncbi:hypothetical protein [Mesorhizobium sp. ES1-1]|uniref:hypothetical protein n=1 Tax=Mesorhizobium sp. ES1-1 TaxID=2876629 RepID=UPI001CCCD168|nr:hypothetical protein [Mesorhizobium sp. ES1-1]MBZ9678836.1 hypothetical protein [Mesorhizobium sp. ES1-1]